MSKMKEAMFYDRLKQNSARCKLCPRKCLIKDGERGDCRARENKKGKLVSLSYGNLCAAAIDPIEKKPLFHFLPGSKAYSIGTAGCNLHCLFCQNWTTSQAAPDEVFSETMEPKEVVKTAMANRCESIAYTYNEPVVFYEYALETAKLAKKKGLKNVIVSNGFIEKEPLLEWCKVIDGANIDLKSFDDKFYRKITGAWLEPVLETIKTLKKEGVWVEVTNLIIPKHNDSMKMIEKMCKWVVNNAGKDVPLHFSAFYPAYKMNDVNPTPASAVLKARQAAMKAGINYAYAGNISAEKEGNTYCPGCGELLIERRWFEVAKNNIKKGKCACGHKIAGVWK